MKLVGFVRVSRITAATSERSNVRRFLAWAESANDEERVDAAVILARTHFAAALRGELQRDLEICLAIIAEDRSSLVRRALAEAVADAASAPRPVILALAGDEPEIASIVLTRSPLLSEGELVEYAVRGEARLQLALARRPGLPPRVAAILAEAGQRDVVIALAKNEQASLAANTLRRIADRFVDDEDVRTALLARHELPSILRFDLIETMSKARAADDGFKVAPARRERMTREASERSAIEVASACEPGEVRDLVRHLRVQGALTAALLMRALISGGRTFFAAAASELSGVAAERVEGLVHDPHGAGFSALYRRMGLPRCFLAAFRAALDAIDELGRESADRASQPIVSWVITACERLAWPELGGLIALLRRLETEAALADARLLVETAAAELIATPHRSEGMHLPRVA